MADGGAKPLTSDSCCCVDLSVWDSCNVNLCGFDITFDNDNFDPLCQVCALPPGWIFTQNPDGSLSLDYSGSDCSSSVGPVPMHFQFCGHNSSGSLGYTVCGYACTQDPTTGRCVRGGEWCCKHFTSTVNCGSAGVASVPDTKPLTVDAGYPNPATSSIRFDYSAPNEATMTLILVNVLGTVLNTTSTVVSKGDGSITIGLAGAQPGAYYCVFELNGQRITRRIQIK